MRICFSPPACMAMLFGAMTLSSIAAEQKLLLQEHLNQTWSQELATYPFTAAKGQCVSESLSLAGPGGPVPVQLSAVELWPDTKFVKSAKLSFLVADLKPLTANNYTVTFGPNPASPPGSDLKAAAAADSVELATSRCRVRLLLGEKTFDPPVPAKDVPGPLPGSSRLYGDAPVKAFAAKLTDSGPVFARVVIAYTSADGNVVNLAATVIAGDNAVRWDTTSKEDHPDAGVEFRLPPVPGVKQAVTLQGYGQWSRADRAAALTPGNEPFTWLSPNTSIANAFPDCSWAVKLVGDGGAELRILSRDPGDWADPVAPMTYGGHKTWNLDMIPQSWENWKRKRLPLFYAADGTVTIKASFAKGARRWSVGPGAPVIGDALNRVKDMVLDWPADPKQPHPRLFVDQVEISDVWKRAATDAELLKSIHRNEDAAHILRLRMKPADQRTPAEVDAALKTVRSLLGLLGNFDVMRSAIRTAAMYDAAVDSGLLSPREQSVFRAQMAYLGYQMADPQTWDMERGYHSGNPNMSISYTLSLGVIAAVLRDHPMARNWAQRATAWQDKWLTDELGPNGEWIPEGSHYGTVSVEPLVAYAVAAQRAGFHDFTNDPRLRKLLLYFAKTQTPRDPQRGNLRASGAWGRGTSGDRHAFFGVAARMSAKSDPAFSQTMQWMWSELGHPIFMGDSRLGGFEPYYEDRRLPAQAPAWTTDLFANLGVLFRSAYNTPHESYLLFLSHTDCLRNLDVWTPGIGGFSQWFGRGKPLSTCFNLDTGYKVRHELLRDGVRLARNWGEPGDPKGPFGHYVKTGPQAVALQPGADYVRTAFTYTTVDDRDWFPDLAPPAYPRVTPAKEPKLDWTRQVLFLKDADPAGPAYLVVRDTTDGGQPTAWQFWTLSEKIGSPEQAGNLDTFLADKPGPKLLPARELPPGNRYTAVGQFDMDVEYFIASPANTPRHTLRYGGPDNRRVPEYQDLLHLQQPGDGAYYVAILPRARTGAAPAFSALADGKVIKVAGAFGTDYCFLAAESTEVKAESARFQGTAGAIQDRPSGVVLTLGTPGSVQYREHVLVADMAASLRVEPKALTVSLPESNPGGDVAVRVPGSWKLAKGQAGVKLTRKDGMQVLTVPAGQSVIRLVN